MKSLPSVCTFARIEMRYRNEFLMRDFVSLADLRGADSRVISPDEQSDSYLSSSREVAWIFPSSLLASISESQREK